jgi:hypothetical protein
VSGLPPGPSAEELLAVVAALRASDARLREVIEARDAQLAAVSTALESAGASSDSPYQKKPGDRSLRGRSGRKPGKLPGAESSALRQLARTRS